MPTRGHIQCMVQRVFLRWPASQRLALGVLDALYQVALLPFRRRRIRASGKERAGLVESTDRFNTAADLYFARFENPAFLLDKPFSEAEHLARHLIDAGVLIGAMRLRPGDVVAEVGAGTCWLSHFLNRFGCKTISIDVSQTALALGREAFQRDPRTKWELEPQFLAYDGHTLPVPDASCDRVVINDAFHHIPNQRRLLAEMQRILRGDGWVALSEPGTGHAEAEHSADEIGRGVLENELVIEDLAALAEECGFRRVTVIAASPFAPGEVPAADLGAFMGGKGFARYWKALCSTLEQHHYILCYKGDSEPTTRRPATLSAAIEVRTIRNSVPTAGMPIQVEVALTNLGDTRWLAGETSGPGWTRLGAHLYRDTEPRQLLDFDWSRAQLPRAVPSRKRVELSLLLPPLTNPGSYVVVFDLVIEGMCWFADRGSRTTTLPLQVRA